MSHLGLLAGKEDDSSTDNTGR